MKPIQAVRQALKFINLGGYGVSMILVFMKLDVSGGINLEITSFLAYQILCHMLHFNFIVELIRGKLQRSVM